jgi:hypothetical protein
MTRPTGQVEAVLYLAERGLNQSQISRATGIPRATIGHWLAGRIPAVTAHHGEMPGEPCRGCSRPLELPEPVFRQYAYLLGIYLGDGSLVRHRRGVFRLRIHLDRAYPGIVRACGDAVAAVIPESRVRVLSDPNARMDVVVSYSKHWPCLLPQHGAGMKHTRRIELTVWQREMLDRHPWSFLRGLIHSDGSRVLNPAVHPHRTYRYPRYEFSNRSADIRALFCEYCEKVGVEWRRANRWNISVARRASVALMDRHIGPKR